MPVVASATNGISLKITITGDCPVKLYFC
jgi:hypothetical protein